MTPRICAAGQRNARAEPNAPGELGEVAGAFNAMADEVVRAEQVRRSLAADVAHELRTPLAALQAGLEELRDGLRHPDAERLGKLQVRVRAYADGTTAILAIADTGPGITADDLPHVLDRLWRDTRPIRWPDRASGSRSCANWSPHTAAQ